MVAGIEVLTIAFLLGALVEMMDNDLGEHLGYSFSFAIVVVLVAVLGPVLEMSLPTLSAMTTGITTAATAFVFYWFGVLPGRLKEEL